MMQDGRCRRFAALILLTCLPASFFAQQVDQTAGVVDALKTSITRNGTGISVRDKVLWNDLLRSDESGRMSAILTDGSVLNLGSNAQMRVTKHDATTQQTSIELLYGRLRSRVVQLMKGGRFEVNTPHATAGVIGTDFILIVLVDRTILIVISGVVLVTPHLAAAAAITGAQTPPPVQVTQGNMVEVGPNGVSAATKAPQSLIQENIARTAVLRSSLTVARTPRWPLLAAGAGFAGAIVAGFIVSRPKDKPKPRVPSIPAQ